MDVFTNIKGIVDTILGEPKRDYAGSGGWYEYNCPHCADENNGIPDNKYNLAITYEGAYFHCWKCGYSGKLSRVIKDYGTRDQLNDYRSELNIIRERLKYSLNGNTFSIYDDASDSFELLLPEGFRILKKTDRLAYTALEYLYDRGVTEKMIERYTMGYIPYSNEGGDRTMMNRIILPSYDEYGTLNYWVGRDYSGKSFMKYKNTNVEKKNIVFNERFINWYEPITLVEGPFDHIVVPNSIPLLGKTLDYDYAVFKEILNRSHSYINIFLDPDAKSNALKIYRLLNSTTLHGRIRLAESFNELDASDIFKYYGPKGILHILRNARELNELDFIEMF